ncbi:MAG: hypothetical protein AAFU41_11840 [Pseudomonadota bacterium]
MRAILPIAILLAGCTSFPTLEDTISDAARDAPYPTLTPLPAIPTAGVDEAEDLNARIAALQQRADRLRRIEVGALQ